MILIHEPDPRKGGVSVEKLIQQCPSHFRESVFGSEQSRRSIHRWHRVTAFQVATLLETAEHIIAALPMAAERSSLRVKGEVPKAPLAKPMTIYISKNVRPAVPLALRGARRAQLSERFQPWRPAYARDSCC